MFGARRFMLGDGALQYILRPLGGTLDYLHDETREFQHVAVNERLDLELLEAFFRRRWFCEMVLWTPWVHQGRIRARPLIRRAKICWCAGPRRSSSS